jgi:hypothetical protein
LTFDEALKNANDRREKKVRSLEKSIHKLERMKFDAVVALSEKEAEDA